MSKRKTKAETAAKYGGRKPKVQKANTGCTQHFRALTRARDWKPIFIRSLSLMPSVRRAAEAAGVAPKTAYFHFHSDPEFAEQWRMALQESSDRLEEACWARATDGWLEPVYSKNRKGDPVLVGHKMQFSDRLAEVLLRGRKRELYGKEAVELSGPGGVPLPQPVTACQVIVNIPPNGRQDTPEDLERLASGEQSPLPALSAPHPAAKPAPETLSQKIDQVSGEASAPEPAKPANPFDWRQFEAQRAQAEFDRLDEQNLKARECLRQQGRLNEHGDGFGYTPLGG